MPCLVKSWIFLVCAALIGLGGCGWVSHAEEPASNPRASEPRVEVVGELVTQQSAQEVACEDPTLTWDTFGDEFVRNWCRGCHSPWLDEGRRYGAPVGVDLGEHDDVQRLAARALARATGDAPTMPPGGGPSDEERELFRVWLECGAP